MTVNFPDHAYRAPGGRRKGEERRKGERRGVECPKCNDEGWYDGGHDINGDLVICPAPCIAGRRELAKAKARWPALAPGA